MQRIGLEWMHRLLQDPRRMSKRYLVDDTRFVKLVWRELRRGGSTR
jgi:N-acetylglucosaminyldiphosphoundecaprenol N-acetyl-beta-D-mannosaminyltransferase